MCGGRWSVGALAGLALVEGEGGRDQDKQQRKQAGARGVHAVTKTHNVPDSKAPAL